MSNNEERIKEIINSKYNGVDNPKIRAEIARKFVLPSEPAPSSKGRPGESVSDYYDRQKSAEVSAKWNEAQMASINAPPSDDRLSALTQRAKLYQDKVAVTHPNRFDREQLIIAEAELSDYQQQKATETIEAEQRKTVEQDPQWQNSLNNAKLILESATHSGDESEVVAATMAVRKLERTTPETLKEDIQKHWEYSASYDDLHALRLQEVLVEKTKTASEAVKAQTDTEIAVVTATHRANIARLNAREASDD